MVYRIKPPQRARITVKRGALIGVTSLNSCLERNVRTVRAAIILNEWGSTSPASAENHRDTMVNNKRDVAESFQCFPLQRQWTPSFLCLNHGDVFRLASLSTVPARVYPQTDTLIATLLFFSVTPNGEAIHMLIVSGFPPRWCIAEAATPLI